jgi:exodeoxyribonuclease VII large subunit
MDALPLRKPETVAALTARIKGGLEQWFRDVWVEGELSNVKFMASSPHAYFTLKDAGAQLPCAFFNAARNAALRAVLRDGAKVRLRGAISVYAPRGAYQLLVRTAEPVGEGELMLRFEALKRALAAEGLFDPARKRPIPALPRTVGVVTSPTGAAIRDILDVLGRRFSGVRVLLAPARVQGDGAAAEVVAGIELLNSLPEPPDVLIVGRGGGSLEDLWCFNDERVARAVRASRVPVVSAVGHEIDFTICDFAADLRAPTPSAAAELVVANRADLARRVESLSGRLVRAARGAVAAARARVEVCARSRAFGRPADVVRHHAQRVDLLSQRLDAALADSIQRARLRISAVSPRPAQALARRTGDARARLAALSAKLSALDPLAVLDRGYALVRSEAGAVVARASALAPGDRFSVAFRDGAVPALALSSDASAAPAPRTPPRRRRPSAPGEEQPTLF